MNIKAIYCDPDSQYGNFEHVHIVQLDYSLGEPTAWCVTYNGVIKQCRVNGLEVLDKKYLPQKIDYDIKPKEYFS